MSQRVFMSCFKHDLKIPAIKTIHDFLERRGCIVTLVPYLGPRCEVPPEGCLSLERYDAFIHPMDLNSEGTMIATLFSDAIELERSSGRPKVFKVWTEPEGKRRIDQMIYKHPPHLEGADRELFDRRTMPEILSRLESFLEALPPLSS
jgi:hypothetical protein